MHFCNKKDGDVFYKRFFHSYDKKHVLKLHAPVSDGRISDRLVEVIARFNNALLQLVDISNVKILSVHCLLHCTPYLRVHQVKIQTVWGTMKSAR